MTPQYAGQMLQQLVLRTHVMSYMYANGPKHHIAQPGDPDPRAARIASGTFAPVLLMCPLATVKSHGDEERRVSFGTLEETDVGADAPAKAPMPRWWKTLACATALAVFGALLCAASAITAWNSDVYIYVSEPSGHQELCANLGGWAIGDATAHSPRCVAALEAARRSAAIWTWSAVFLSMFSLFALPAVAIAGLILSIRRRRERAHSLDAATARVTKMI